MEMQKEVAATATASNVKLKTYTIKERNLYLLGMFGQNIIYNIVGAALAYYLQFTLLIPAMAVSTIMTIARVWDAFNDPMMGTIVDKTRSKWGKCRPYLLFVPIPILIVTILCFLNFGFYDPNGSVAKNVLIVGWAAITYIMWGMTYTVGDIPLWGITALMTEDEKDRNKLLSLARVAGGVAGGITMLAIQPIAFAIGNLITQKVGVNMAGSQTAWDAILANAQAMSAQFKQGLAAGIPYEQLKPLTNVDGLLAQATREGERWGFLIAAILFGIVGCGLFQLAGLKTKERVKPSEKTYTLKQNFQLMWKNKPFRQILLSGILGSTKMLIAIAAMPLITYYFASKDPLLSLVYMVLLGGGMFGGQFVIMALAPKLLTKFSKKKLYNYGNLLGIIPYLAIFAAYLISPQGLAAWYFIAIFFVLFSFVGVSTGLTTILQSYMIADCIDYEEYTNGVRPDGVFFAGQTFITKLTTGIATIIGGVCYSIVGFSDDKIAVVNDYISAGIMPRDVPEFQPYMMILFLLVSIPPAIGCILSVIPTWHYCLDDDVHNKILAELNERRIAARSEEESEDIPEEIAKD